MIHRFRELYGKFQKQSLLELMQTIFYKLGMEFAPFHWFQEGIFENSQIDFDGQFSGYNCVFLESEDVPVLLELETWRGYSGKSLDSMFSAGKKCISLQYQGKIAAFMWIDLHESNCKWYSFPLEEDEAYLFDMYTLKEFRGKNIAPYLRYKSYEILEKNGRKKFYSYSDSFNTPAIRFKKKINAKILKIGFYFAFSKKIRFIFYKNIENKKIQYRFLSNRNHCYP